MDQRTFFFPDEGISATTSTLGLPADLLDKARRRLRILAGLILVATGADLLQMVIGAIVERAERGAPTGTDLLVLSGTAGTFLGALVILALTRSQRVSNARLIDVGLTFEVLVCLLIAVTNPLSRFEEAGSLPTMTWVTALIIFFPMIVPSPPRRTLITALLAASTRPLGLWLLHTLGEITLTGKDVASATFSPALGVVIAYFGSRAIYDLGLDVARARRMGSYELETLLGRGGMGEVWRARHRMLARPAAVKLIRPEFLGGIESRDRRVALHRFEREAQSTAALRSPHTIELFDFGITDDGTFYYVMELLEGLDTQTLVQKHGPLPWPRAVFLLEQVCHSLAEAHEVGFIHRDIKPANVFVCRYGRDLDFVKVLDFGLVKTAADPLEANEPLTVQGAVSGTPAFMAPEQAMGKAESDARSDIYAVGCLAYWLLTGCLVFEGETPLEILVHHAKTPPVPPSQRTEMPISPTLERLVMACLEKEPSRRPQRVDKLSVKLAACVAGDDGWSQEQARHWWESHHPDR